MTIHSDQIPVLVLAAIMIALVVSAIPRRSFDPFAPIWLFLAGYAQVYVIQALSYRDYALGARGVELVTSANQRALWALILYLMVYFSGLGKVIARRLPAAPARWSTGLVVGISPVLALWGLSCAWLVLRVWNSPDPLMLSQERQLLAQFPTVHLVAGVLLLVTGRQPDRPRPALTVAGLILTLSYTAIWMYFGRRSHSLFGVLTTLCALYVPRYRRPSMAVLTGAAVVGCLVVALALGWRHHRSRTSEQDADAVMSFLQDFDPSAVLVSLNIKESPNFEGIATREARSRETEEYGGFLLMMATVPQLARYDYGESYIRLVSTYIPRMIWRDKPYFGRAKWIAAWVAGSEFERKDDFTGPAISILGAGQLNGGALGTALLIVCVALVQRTGYDYFRSYAHCPWAQAWWTLTYFNAWLMSVNDDPFVWFYYLYGHTILPPMVLFWVVNKLSRSPRAAPALA